MNARRRSYTDEVHQRDRWLLSYADMVTLLLGLFIVLYAASDAKRAQQIAASFAADPANGGILDGGRKDDGRESLRRAVVENVALMEKAKLREGTEGLVVSFAESGFFSPGDAAIDPASGPAIDALARALAGGSGQVRVEGHTDSLPISTTKFPSNWELSTARAANVLARLVEHGVAPERLSAAGFAGFRPVEDNSTPEGRAQNRRVDIVILGR